MIVLKKRLTSAISTANPTWRWSSAAACRSFAPMAIRRIFQAMKSRRRNAHSSEQSQLKPPSSTAPFVGLFGTVFGIINAFRGMKNAETAGIAAVAGGISEALFTTALGLLVAVPAVWLFNYFTGKVDGFVVEMDNSASELVDYFIKNRTKQLKA